MLARGLAYDPQERFADPAALCHALNRAIDRADQRNRTTRPVSWEIGSHSRVGRAKEALDRANEDAVLTRTFDNPGRAFAVVADGITMCDVGTGALASLLTCLALDNTIDENCTAETFEPLLMQACRRASENLLTWAVERKQLDTLREGGDQAAREGGHRAHAEVDLADDDDQRHPEGDQPLHRDRAQYGEEVLQAQEVRRLRLQPAPASLLA